MRVSILRDLPGRGGSTQKDRRGPGGGLEERAEGRDGLEGDLVGDFGGDRRVVDQAVGLGVFKEVIDVELEELVVAALGPSPTDEAVEF